MFLAAYCHEISSSYQANISQSCTENCMVKTASTTTKIPKLPKLQVFKQCATLFSRMSQSSDLNFTSSHLLSSFSSHFQVYPVSTCVTLFLLNSEAQFQRLMNQSTQTTKSTSFQLKKQGRRNFKSKMSNTVLPMSKENYLKLTICRTDEMEPRPERFGKVAGA